MEAATLPDIRTAPGQKRRLRDDELPTIIYIGDSLTIPVKTPVEEVAQAMQGHRGKLLDTHDFYTGWPVHVRVEHISAVTKAVELPPDRRQR